MIRTVTLDRSQKPTDKQIEQIKEAAKREIVFDEDSPELTPAMQKAFRLAAKNRNTQKRWGYRKFFGKALFRMNAREILTEKGTRRQISCLLRR